MGQINFSLTESVDHGDKNEEVNEEKKEYFDPKQDQEIILKDSEMKMNMNDELTLKYGPSLNNNYKILKISKNEKLEIKTDTIQYDYIILEENAILTLNSDLIWNSKSKQGGRLNIIVNKNMILHCHSSIHLNYCGYSCYDHNKNDDINLGEAEYAQGGGAGGGSYGTTGQSAKDYYCLYEHGLVLRHKGTKAGKLYGDNTMNPLWLGSSGGYYGGRGGGALNIKINGNLIMQENSIISCNGQDSRDWSGGGGSGGSIKIECDQMFNNGFIHCLGGSANIVTLCGTKYSGDGGKGKIFITCNNYDHMKIDNIDPYPCNMVDNNKTSLNKLDQIEQNTMFKINNEIKNDSNNFILNYNSICYLNNDIKSVEYDNMIIEPHSILTCSQSTNENATIEIKINKYLIVQNYGQINFNACYKHGQDGVHLKIQVNKGIIIFNNGIISTNGNFYGGNGGTIEINCPIVDVYHGSITSIGRKGQYKVEKEEILGKNGQVIIHGQLNLFDHGFITEPYIQLNTN